MRQKNILIGLSLLFIIPSCRPKKNQSSAVQDKVTNAASTKILQKGMKAPDFSGVTQDQTIISSKDYHGKKYVLFFYPKANTIGCTAEACNLRDNYEALKAKEYEIIGVSADSPEEQKKWTDEYQLPFPLIADENKEIIKAFGVGGTYGIHRTTFVINEKGMIEKVITSVKVKEHAAQILE